MPFIQITILEGRSPEKKERLIREVTDIVAEVSRGTSSKMFVFGFKKLRQNIGALQENL